MRPPRACCASCAAEGTGSRSDLRGQHGCRASRQQSDRNTPRTCEEIVRGDGARQRLTEGARSSGRPRQCEGASVRFVGIAPRKFRGARPQIMWFCWLNPPSPVAATTQTAADLSVRRRLHGDEGRAPLQQPRREAARPARRRGSIRSVTDPSRSLAEFTSASAFQTKAAIGTATQEYWRASAHLTTPAPTPTTRPVPYQAATG
jgi:hypothetical protein